MDGQSERDRTARAEPVETSSNSPRPNLALASLSDPSRGDASLSVDPSTPRASDENESDNVRDSTPLAPLAQPTDSTLTDSTVPPLTPRTRQRQLHFADTPLTHSYDPHASTSTSTPALENSTLPPPRLPSASSSRSSALGLYSTSTPATPHKELPPPTLPQTVQDLRTLLKSFLLLVPSSLRKLRFLIPSAVRDVARIIIHQIALVLHARKMLPSNIIYDVVAALWRGVINIFFREIRSRGSWKIPRVTEGATIFVVGPHHNQVGRRLEFPRRPQQARLATVLTIDVCPVPRSSPAHERSQAREWEEDQLLDGGEKYGTGLRWPRVSAHAKQYVFLTPDPLNWARALNTTHLLNSTGRARPRLSLQWGRNDFALGAGLDHRHRQGDIVREGLFAATVADHAPEVAQ